VRSITIIAILAAAAAGIIAAAALYANSYGYIGTLDWQPSSEQDAQPGPVTGNQTSNNSGYSQVNVTLSNFTLVADIAATNDQRTKGLAVKDTLNEDEGMLFVFSTSREHSFWMMGMKFPIDIIWISQNHEVVHIEHSLEPCVPDSPCPTYKPDRNSLYVLETVAGFAQKYNVTENDYVDFTLDE
jgi:uncharacterized protein